MKSEAEIVVDVLSAIESIRQEGTHDFLEGQDVSDWFYMQPKRVQDAIIKYITGLKPDGKKD